MLEGELSRVALLHVAKTHILDFRILMKALNKSSNSTISPSLEAQ